MTDAERERRKEKYKEAQKVRESMGKPPKFKTVEEMQEKIDAYFKACEGEVLRDDDGKPYLNKWGEAVIIGKRPLTMSGLANALGFESRFSLRYYKGKPAFRSSIQRAQSRIEQYTEERLFDKDGSNGAKFSLQNNFKGWDVSKEQAKENAAPVVNIINDIPRPAEPVEESAETEETDDGASVD